MSSAAHYHADGNGNVTMLVGTGLPTIKAYYKYDPFGRTIGSAGSLVGVNAMRFSSKPVMGSSELYYYGYRFYDPSSQRWLNRDPLGEFDCENVYAFVRNASLGAFDLMGLFGCRPSPCADPCGEAKRLNRDMGDIGGVVCCGGKAFVCLWKSGGSTGAGKGLASEITDECARVHENAHVPDVDCSKSKDFDRGGPKPGVKNTISECKAFKAQSACLKNSIKRCDGNPQCIADVLMELKYVKLNIDQLCGAPN
jgi:RHS repeat-associated protein